MTSWLDRLLTPEQRQRMAERKDTLRERRGAARAMDADTLVMAMSMCLGNMGGPRDCLPGEPTYDATLYHVYLPELQRRVFGVQDSEGELHSLLPEILRYLHRTQAPADIRNRLTRVLGEPDDARSNFVFAEPQAPTGRILASLTNADGEGDDDNDFDDDDEDDDEEWEDG